MAQDGQVTLQTRDLVKQFKSKTGAVNAVNGVTLQVHRGETYGLIGPDGAGKTTLTRVTLGLLRRTSGESSILGYDSMRDTYAIRERVGYIAQQLGLPHDLTVMENVRFFADVHGVDRQDKAVFPSFNRHQQLHSLPRLETPTDEPMPVLGPLVSHEFVGQSHVEAKSPRLHLDFVFQIEDHQIGHRV